MMGSSRNNVACGLVLRCASCGFGFRASRVDENALEQLYADLDINVYESELRGRLATARRHLRIVHHYCSPARLLDVGCASGLFLRTAADQGWNVIGVEPSTALSALASNNLKDRGVVVAATLQNANLEEKSFDAVTLWDVLEHVPNPLEFLDACARLLKPDGFLFVNVPDLDSIQARLLGTRWPLLLPEHLNYFCRKSLTLCGERAGLSRVGMGRRKASFSVEYVLYRLQQHQVIGASIINRVAKGLHLGSVVVPISLGELYTVWRPSEHSNSKLVA
jgi:SAM-dependent methyltransferase